MNLFSKAGWQSALHRLRLAPKGSGKPASAEAMDAEYRSDHWKLLDDEAERPRYEAVARHLQDCWPGGDLLDVGCGQGRLLDFLEPGRLQSYLGIDFSPTAIGRARCREQPRCRFEVADFNTWHDPAPRDRIVFNETIGYAFNPVAVLARYRTLLTPTGFILVSLFRSGNSPEIWRRIGGALPLSMLPPLQASPERVWDIGIIPGP